MTKNAYVTLVATDIYAAGALVIAHRLRDFGSTEDLVCLVTGNISDTVVEHLSQLYKVISVDTLKSADEENLTLLGRPELDITFTKLHVWNLIEYTKLVFLDADTLPLRNIDDLFDRPNFSAAPDAGWPDCFNSGVFVTEPSDMDYHGLKKMATEHGSFDGGDQGLLNRYFGSWSQSSSAHRLPFTYNTTPTSQYSYAPAHQYYVNNIAICHFIGTDKPWKYQRFSDGNVMSRGWKGLTDLIQSWWDTWNLYYGQNQPHLLLSKSPKDTHLVSHTTTPVKIFSNPIINAWDSQNISDDIELYKHHRRLCAMPPLENITISTPKWAPQDMQASSYPGLSDVHTVISSIDETSQYSSHNNETDSFDYETDPSGFHASYDNKEPADEPQSAEPIMDNNRVYQTIDWNPAYESPPDTGMAADIPDLSTFVNAWDQPFHDQSVWIAPEPQPIPKMEHDYGFVHERHHDIGQESSAHNSHQQNDYQHPQNVFPWEASIQQPPDPTRIWLDEQILCPPDDQIPFTQDNLQCNDHHLDSENTQIEHAYNDHQQSLELQQFDDDDNRVDLDSYQGSHQQSGQHDQLTDSQHATYNDTEQQSVSTPTYAMDMISPSLMSPRRTPGATFDNNDQAEYDWSDRDLIPIQLKSSSKLNVDGLSPKIPSSPINSRRSSLSRSRRPSITSIKSYQRTPSGSSSPVISSFPTLDYSHYSHQPTSIFAHETLSYSKKTPYTSAAATPVRERTSFLYETGEEQRYLRNDNGQYDENENDKRFEVNPFEGYVLDYSFEDPLKATSSAYRQSYRHQQTQWDPQAALTRLQHASEFIMRQHSQEPSSSLETPTAIENAEDYHGDVNKRTETEYALDAITIKKLPQEDIGRPFYASGSSSPRTPVIQGLDSNLTAEIEAAKEQHRQQQQASLSLLQPHTAVATLLEAQLDLSKSNLFNRRNDNNNRNASTPLHGTDIECSSSSAPTNTALSGTRDMGIHQEHTDIVDETTVSDVYDSNKRTDQEVQHQHADIGHQNTDESFTAYFDTSVIETAHRKLNALTRNIPETSVSSTTTMNEQQDDGSFPDLSYGGSLDNLSRYSFPPAHFEYMVYQQNPAMDTTSGEVDLELATSTSSTLHEIRQDLDQDAEDMVHLQQALDDTTDSTTDDYTQNNNGDVFNNSNDQNVATWLSLTATDAMIPTQQTAENNHANILDTVSTGNRSCDSEDDEDGDIVIGTIDCIINTDGTNTTSIRETAHTHTFVESRDTSSTTTYSPKKSGLGMDSLDTTTTEGTPSASPPPTSLAANASLSMVSAHRDEATTSTISASDDGDTTFLSAIDRIWTPSGSSSISSTAEWYTAGSSTPVLDDNESNYGSEQEHETAVSLLEMRTESMVNRSTEPAAMATHYSGDTDITTPTTPTYRTYEESFPSSTTATTSSTNTTTFSSNIDEDAQPDYEHSTTTIIETIYISDSLSIGSENTETGSN